MESDAFIAFFMLFFSDTADLCQTFKNVHCMLLTKLIVKSASAAGKRKCGFAASWERIMDITLVTASNSKEVHGTDNDKKTGCGINLFRGENVTIYRRIGRMTDLKEITCERCKANLAKKMIRSDKKEMNRLLKEERQRAKLGMDDEGIVPLGNTTAKITRAPEEIRREELSRKAVNAPAEPVPSETAAPQNAPAPVQQPSLTKPAQQTIPGTGVAIDASLAAFAIQKPAEEKPQEDDFLAQFAVQTPEQPAPAPQPSQNDFLAQFAVPSPSQPAPQAQPAPAPQPSQNDFLAQFAVPSQSAPQAQSAPAPQPAYQAQSAPAQTSGDNMPNYNAPQTPVLDNVDDILSMFSVGGGAPAQPAPVQQQYTAPVQPAAPMYEDMAPVQPAAPMYEDMAPVQPVAPVLEDIAPVQYAAPEYDASNSYGDYATQEQPSYDAVPETPSYDSVPEVPSYDSVPEVPVYEAEQPTPAAAPSVQQQVITVPQFTGYDANGLPVYNYIQMAMTGIDQNGQPIFAPIDGQPFTQAAPVAPVAPVAAAPAPAPVVKQPAAPRPAPYKFSGTANANISKIAVNPHMRQTSQAFINAIASSKEYADKNLIDTQGLKANTPVLSSIEDVLSTMGDDSLKNKMLEEKLHKQQEIVPKVDEYRGPVARSSSRSVPPQSRNSYNQPKDPRTMSKSELKAYKKTEKINAKFKKDLAKRGF